MSLAGFAESAFTSEGVTRTLYRRGGGPGVVIVHEIPGITPEVVLTKDLVDEDGHPTRAALERVLSLFRERLLAA